MAFTFVDLFAGIGGFHAALGASGGECWFASEIDPMCQDVYERNWGMRPEGDIVPLTEDRMAVPAHDVLAAGFPCQPFSKSGYQRGMAETRGTLFFNICKVLEAHKPPVILLENVRNLAGPRQQETWATIVATLRELGYRVSSTPAVFSPHLLDKDLGGRPQVRERVFITGTYVGRARAEAETDVAPIVTPKTVHDWPVPDWNLERDLPLDDDADIPDLWRYQLTTAETRWVEVWNDFIARIDEPTLPGHPIWADEFRYPAEVPAGTPAWKANFLRKNADLYLRNKGTIDAWLEENDYLRDFPASRRKLEWQAQDTPRDLFQCVLHLRPSGIRAKKPTYLPALVAITQTSIYGPRRRRITPREAARLQGLPDWFFFGKPKPAPHPDGAQGGQAGAGAAPAVAGDAGLADALAAAQDKEQPNAATYRQLGNGVNVGAAYFVFRQHVLRDAEEIAKIAPHVLEAVLQAGPEPVVTQGSGSGPLGHGPGQGDAATGEVAVGGGQQVALDQDHQVPLVHR